MPQAPQVNKYRGFCVTINNPVDQDEWDWARLKSVCQYCTYGEEVGEGGTNHWQGFVYFKDRVVERTVRRLLPRAHVEPMRGSINQAIDYCHKDGVFTEFGDKPDGGGRDAQSGHWGWLVEHAEKGMLDAIKERFPSYYVRYYERLRALRRRSLPILDGELAHEWWYGPTGTGKSRTLWEMYPNHYQKELNKWWCGYQDQDVVAIEEWAPKNECTASFLKIWADRYPFTAQVKGGTLVGIRPKKIIVLSNYTIDQCFPNEEDALPLKRRFKVRHFPEMFREREPEYTVSQMADWLREIECTESLLDIGDIVREFV